MRYQNTARSPYIEVQPDTGKAVVCVPLTKGMRAIVDIEDAPLVEGKLWHVSGGRRHYANTYGPNQEHIALHRLIMGFPDSHIDHVNGNTMDNRRANLRLASPTQNNANRPKHPRLGGAASEFKGVSKHRGKWMARLVSERKEHYLGVFNCPSDAARAYDEAATRIFGGFAVLNFPCCFSSNVTERDASPAAAVLEDGDK